MSHHSKTAPLPFPLRPFLKSVLALSAVSLILRWVGLRFSLLLSSRLGGQVLGVWELILSVRAFAVTICCAGVSLGGARLGAEMLGRGSGNGVRAVMKRVLIYGAVAGGISALALILFADPIALSWIGHAEAASPLRLLALSLPLIALSSGMSGYFSAARRAGRSAVGQLGECAVRIGVTLILLDRAEGDALMSCVIGLVAAEGASFLYQALLYRAEMARVSHSGAVPASLTKSLLGITLPVALSSYLRSGLVTLEHMLIPRGLRAYGASYEQSLASYGTISSVSLPMVLFPSAPLQSACALLIPEIARLKEKGERESILSLARTLLRAALIYGIGAAAVMISLAPPLSEAAGRGGEVREHLLLLAPLLPVMFLDSATDAVLKGLGEQVWCMGVNVADAAISAAAVTVLVPRMGIKGYVAVILISEVINASLSLGRLIYLMPFRPAVGRFVLCPMGAAMGSCCMTAIVMSRWDSAVAGGLVCGGMYLGLVWMMAFGGGGKAVHCDRSVVGI